MNTNSEFLIIVPTLNSYKKLEKLVFSLKFQTYKNWRTIFIDGPSNKEHKNWIKNCSKRDHRFLVVEEKIDKKGIFPSMSYGAEFAKDDNWIVFLGSDDFFNSEDALQNIKKRISFFQQKKHEPKLLICGTRFVKEGTNKTVRVDNFPNLEISSIRKLSQLIFMGYIPTHQSLFFSSELLKKIMPYSNKYLLAGDLDMIFKMMSLKNLEIIYLNQKLINIETGGISSRLLLLRLKEVLLIYFKYYNFLFFIPISFRYFKKISARFTSIKLIKNFFLIN